MVRELFEMARGKKACIIFFDEIDAVGGKDVDSLTTKLVTLQIFIDLFLFHIDLVKIELSKFHSSTLANKTNKLRY